MNKIEQQLNKIKQAGRLGLMTHVVIGYPNLEESYKLVKMMAEVGVDFVELQIPFTDPVADGPTIMQANKVALENGTKVKDAFKLMSRLTQEVKVPLLFMSYFNIVFNYGVEKFCQEAKKAGASGLIIPDIPLEEENYEYFQAATKKHNLISIRVLSPASTTERMEKNAQNAQGFVYFVSRKGTTGLSKKLDPELNENLRKLRKYFEIPIAVGFGISTKEHLLSLQGRADIAVIGSALINAYNKGGSMGLQHARQFLTKLG